MISDLWESLQQALSSQIFGGGLALMLAGAAMALARNVPARLFSLVKRQIIVSVDVLSGDPLFDRLTVWLDRQPYSRHTRSLTATGRAMGAQHGNPSPPGAHALPPPLMLTPAPGAHLFWYRGRPVWLSRERKEVTGAQGEWGGYRETITIRIPGRSQATVRALLEEAGMAAIGERRVGVYIIRYGEWYRVSEAEPRPLDTVPLAGGVMEDLRSDAERFFASREKYRRRGIPWYRRYLLEGPPGNGKTSAISALAATLGIDLYYLAISNHALTDDRLLAQLTQVPERSAVLLEDVDALVDGREMTGEGGVTFSGLLNALDGVAARPGCLVYMTTNHPDRLDPALIRKGRVDVRKHFAPATTDQAARRFLSFFFEDNDPRLAWRFGEAVEGWSMADVQGVLLDHEDDPEAAVAAVEQRAGRPRLETAA